VKNMSWSADTKVTSNRAGLIALAQQRQRAAVKKAGKVWMKQTAEWMQSNASWKDNTGDARGSLGVVPTYTATEFRYSLSGGVTYLRFLELSRAGKFAIIGPATDICGAALLQSIGAVRR
jgi:hypothetical protein